MKHHERESFIYTIRSGKTYIENNLIILPPSIDILAQSYIKYNETYEQCLYDGIMTEDDMIVWLKEHQIWTKFHENTVENLKKEIEDLKVKIYESRKDPKACKNIKYNIANKEELLNNNLSLKNSQYSNTCEAMATNSRMNFIISNTTYLNNKPYDFKEYSVDKVLYFWQNSILTESQCRELVRNEPWRSTWAISKNTNTKLFYNPKKSDLTINQKNLVIWSQIYDNSYESMESPEKSVYEDDDMFDGWMILQSRKNEKQKHGKYAEEITNNKKIKSASEVFVVANNNDHAENIYNLNSDYGKHIIKNRFAAIEHHGSLSQNELPDEALNLQMQHNARLGK